MLAALLVVEFPEFSRRQRLGDQAQLAASIYLRGNAHSSRCPADMGLVAERIGDAQASPVTGSKRSQSSQYRRESLTMKSGSAGYRIGSN